jgi:NTP pyrophosphatase (non-canonical NTP hydrolase)
MNHGTQSPVRQAPGLAHRESTAGPAELSVAVCGSFRRDPDGLRAVIDQLRLAGCAVLSPVDLDFVGERRGFAYAEHEAHRLPSEIEATHIRAMEQADFVWLHAPSGYVGPSAAMELGHAHALGLRVFAAHSPVDIVFESLVTVVAGPRDAIRDVERDPAAAPGRGLSALQEYYGRAARIRGWDDESPQDCLLLLTEEMGELARAMRKTEGIAREGPYLEEDPRLELADVQLYVLHLANALEIDLASAVEDKERINGTRFASRTAAA